MNYFELYTCVRDTAQAEIRMAELSEWPFETFELGETFVKAYIRADELAGHRARIEEFLRSTGDEWNYTEIEHRNWNELWESNFDPVEVRAEGKRAVVRAPFHDEPAGDEVLDVVIMPKMSFGTGHHATTHLMIAALLHLDVNGRCGLDMGSGTGVLAIVVAKRGASHVDAVDIDEWAFENCTENIGVNGVADRVTPIRGDVSAIAGRSYDFILANINRNILLADMAAYLRALRAGGTLLMSGILTDDIPAIAAAATALGMTVGEHHTKDGWAMVVCHNKVVSD